MKITTKWLDGLEFLSEAETGHGLPLASRLDESQKLHGVRPVELLLHAIAGCSAMDIISILQKMRQPVEKFWIETDGERSESHPKVFTKITLTYHVQGNGIDRAAVEKAVNLSHTKYCSVSAMLHHSCAIESQIELHNSGNTVT